MGDAAVDRSDETQRLAALRRLGVFGTTGNARFDQIADTTALALEVATAAISLLDEKDQWSLSCHGNAPRSVPRHITLCEQAIKQEDLFVIEDARSDPRFVANPLVTGGHLAFYAGFPLLSLEGFALGTLCIIDPKPRQLNQRSRDILRGLGSWAQSELNAVERERLRMEAAGRRLLGPAVHQIRGALTGIHGFSEYLLNQPCAEEQRLEITGIIHEQAGQVSVLVDELVDLFQVEAAAGRDFQLAALPLAPLVKEVAARLPDTARVELFVDETLPPARVDRTRLEQALYQLLSFAADPAKQHGIEISLKRASSPDFVELTIKHRSSALEESELPRIFEPFFRTSSSEGVRNEGRSLALVKEIIALHRGTLTVSSPEGAGTVEAVLRLPI